jgi:hypothetical protein
MQLIELGGSVKAALMSSALIPIGRRRGKINDSELSGWDAVALVEQPAIEENFIAFGKQNKPKITDEYILEQLLRVEFGDKTDKSINHIDSNLDTLNHNEFAQELREKMRVIGPVMTPSKLIPRVTEDGEPYEVFFSAETIEKIAHKAMKEQKIHKVNIEHDKDMVIEDAFMVETWLVEDEKKDKSTLYGFKPVKGQWFAIYQLGKETWDEYIKTGLVQGYSIEGYFIEKLIKK